MEKEIVCILCFLGGALLYWLTHRWVEWREDKQRLIDKHWEAIHKENLERMRRR